MPRSHGIHVHRHWGRAGGPEGLGGRNRLKRFLQRSPKSPLLRGRHQIIRGMVQEDETTLEPVAKVGEEGLEQMVEQFS